tara:strand:+ start:238 stop:399 length:162 start_codon:yes stop_codon:yes gene_type:complete
MASIALSKSIGGGGSGYTYPTYSMRLEGIPDPLQGIPIDRFDRRMMLYFGLKK